MATEHKSKLAARLAGVNLSSLKDPAPQTDTLAARPAPRTALGMHAQQIYADRTVHSENQRMKAELALFDGALPTRLLNPSDIVPSHWANRHDLSFSTDEFNELKLEIGMSGGNIQPIKVRPKVDGSGQFEIVFGHRRHRACAELGLQVLCMVESVSDQDLFAQMCRENLGRANLRPYEQGVMYAKALDSGLYPSLRKLAIELQLDHSSVSKLIAIARLPPGVIAAFASPLDIQYAWGYRLSKVIEASPEWILARAAEIIKERESGSQYPASVIFSRLLPGAENRSSKTGQSTVISGIDGRQADVHFKGREAVVTFTNFPSEKRFALEQLISRFLGGD